MAYFSSVTKSNLLLVPSEIPLFQRLSLRAVKGIAVVFLLITSLELLMLWQPTYHQLRTLQNDKTYWQQVLRTGATNTIAIPTMDQLPDIIEQCRGAFVKEGVLVVSINVERFGERRETGNGTSLDYGLVRLHLLGDWEGIVTSLKALEETVQDNSIHVQEVILRADGGETLLQIYFIGQ